MRRYRRLVLIDRVIPFLAALVGLVALAGAVLAQLDAASRTQAVGEALTELRGELAQLRSDTAALAAAADDGTAAGLLALQERMVKLESAWEARPVAAAPAVAPTEGAPAAPAEPDPALPSTDCIPLGTRFIVTPNESYPLCQSRAVVRTGAITGDSVEIDGAGTVVETGFGALLGTSCTVMVFSADEAGFAEVRVTCT